MAFTDRTEIIATRDGVRRLREAKVILFGVGGVGSYVAEALARAGVGSLTIVDKDVVDETNINRQIIALNSTIGQPKVEVAKRRLKDINPEIEVEAVMECFTAENSEDFNFEGYDFVVDAVDMVGSKIELIRKAKNSGVPIISSMGMGNRVHPEKIKITDISKTEIDPLAKKVRQILRKEGIKKVPVAVSTEYPLVKSSPPGSVSTVPSAAGLVIASYVINSILGVK